MKKGFTLVELLAVIVILSIIAIITIPMIKGVIDKVKLGSLEDSVYGLKSAAELYYSSNGKMDTTEFICSDNGCISNTGKKLDYKGKVEGKIKLFSDGKVSICLTSDNYASSILANEKKATTKMGGCDEETYEISEVISIEKYNKVNSDYLLVKNTLYNKTLISNINNDANTISQEINNLELGRNEEQLKNELYDKLQYSGLVTEGMTYDEMLEALKNRFPMVIDLMSSLSWVNTSTPGSTAYVSQNSLLNHIVTSKTSGVTLSHLYSTSSKIDIQSNSKISFSAVLYAGLSSGETCTYYFQYSSDGSTWNNLSSTSYQGYSGGSGIGTKSWTADIDIQNGGQYYFRVYAAIYTYQSGLYWGYKFNSITLTKQ